MVRTAHPTTRLYGIANRIRVDRITTRARRWLVKSLSQVFQGRVQIGLEF